MPIAASGECCHAFMDDFTECFPVIAPTHTFENGIIATLKRDMEMRHKVVAGPHGIKKFICDFLGLYGAESKANAGMGLADCSHQVRDIVLFLKVFAIHAHMDSGDHNFFVPCLFKTGCLFQDFIQRYTAAGASGVGDDAVGTEGTASILDLQIGPCSIRERSDIKGIERGVGLILLE